MMMMMMTMMTMITMTIMMIKNKRRRILKNYTFLTESFTSTFIAVFFVAAMAITGCGETENPLEQEPAAISDTTSTGLIAEMKGFANTVPAAPSAPAAQNNGIPKVISVSYFSDLQLTKPISGSVPAGTTIYTKVVFSEPLTYKPADDNTARPILYYRANGKIIRYHVNPQGAKEAELSSGDAKPIGKQATEFVGKYSVQTEDTGMFRLLVGKLNTDTDGNNLAAFYRSPAKLQIGQSATNPNDDDSPAKLQGQSTTNPNDDDR